MCWLNRDPIEEKGGVNLYEFCRNTPFDNVDMYGFFGSVWGYSPSIHGPASAPFVKLGDELMRNKKEPSVLEQFGNVTRTLHQETFFERRYPSSLQLAKKYFTKGINISVVKDNCLSNLVHKSLCLDESIRCGGGKVYLPLMRADEGMYMVDKHQDWSERWMSLGNFSFCVKLPVNIEYEVDRARNVKKFTWETYIYVSDDLGIQKDDGWLYYATLGFLPGGGIAPSRRIERARWPLKGGGECKCK